MEAATQNNSNCETTKPAGLYNNAQLVKMRKTVQVMYREREILRVFNTFFGEKAELASYVEFSLARRVAVLLLYILFCLFPPCCSSQVFCFYGTPISLD